MRRSRSPCRRRYRGLCTDVPILGVDEGIHVECRDVAALGGFVAVLDDQGRELGLEIALHRCVGVERIPVSILVLVGGVDSLHERRGGRFGRRRLDGAEGDADRECNEEVASRDHDDSMRSCEPEFVRSRICWVGPPHLRRDLIHFADHHPQGSTSGGKGIFRILILTEGTSRKPLDDGRKHRPALIALADRSLCRSVSGSCGQRGSPGLVSSRIAAIS